MNLKKLHEEFIEKANRPMMFGKPPIEPKEPAAPIIAVERWHEVSGCLVKTYHFREIDDRERFVSYLFSYERDVGHHAVIMIDRDKVSLRLTTHDVGRPSELDKEYARFADVTFKDIVYNVSNGI